MSIAVSVVMPAFNQEPFAARAVESLLAQRFEGWECVFIDDGSTDDTCSTLRDYLDDPRFRYARFDTNRGLGAALNAGIELARAPFIAYLPCDDLYYADHLASLFRVLLADERSVLAYSGVRHHYNRESHGLIEGERLQLVQAMHRKNGRRWLEREELVTDDLDRMFWSALREDGGFRGTGAVTCEWVDHPDQRHKTVREPLGGINAYRSRYRVAGALRFHSSAGSLMDEPGLYNRFRERPDTPFAADGLKIVLVGELAYNPDRMLALEERGHKLYGLWMDRPHAYNTVGPLPFGHVEDLPRDDWRNAVRRIRPDLFYGLLNWQAVPWAHHVMTSMPDIPFVWHFKEGPFICLNRGTFPQLLDLYRYSAGRIDSTPEMREWFLTVAPEAADLPSLTLDGDLPKREWFDGEFSPKLSCEDGEFHTVVPGRPIGLHSHVVEELARLGVHLHFYGEATHSLWREWIERTTRLARGYLHLHPNADQRRWVSEFSRYDAGWLHFFASRNEGEIARAEWDDLNYPARAATLVAAGLPLLQRDNSGHAVASQALANRFGIGLEFRETDELAAQLRDRGRMARVSANVHACRLHFTFDYHVARLEAFFREIVHRSG